jgi:hypothetical protein
VTGPRSNASRGATSSIACVAALLAVLALGWLAAAQATIAAPRDHHPPSCAPGVDLLGFSDALDKRRYEGTDVGGLSALAPVSRDRYLSLVDNQRDTPARVYTLRIPVERERLAEPTIRDVTVLRRADGEPFTGADLDGEGLVATRRGELLVASETEPSIRRFSSEGRLLDELAVPQRFRVAPEGEGQPNQTFESLALSPSGRSLFTAVEGPLAADGRTQDGRARIRILRYERGPGGTYEPAEEFFYLAEAGQGVVEIVALSDSDLLVLERGFVSGEGNTVRIFRASLAGAPDVAGEPTLADPGLDPLAKGLLVDLSDCPAGGAQSPGTQENPLLDNFEGLALGPRLSGGRRTLLLQSDDNFNDVQVTRVVALAARLQEAPASGARARP